MFSQRAKDVATYGILTVALVLFFASLLMSLDRIKDAHETEVKATASNFWTASQADYELQRLINALDRYVLTPGQVSRDDLLERFDLFWSRLPVLIDGEQGQGLLATTNARTVVPALIGRLQALEPKLMALRPAEPADYDAIRAELVAVGEPLHDIFVQIHHANRDRFIARESAMDRLYSEHLHYQIGILASTVTFIGFLFWQIRRARVADAMSKEASAQLRAVIDAVPARISAVDRLARYIFVNRFHAESHGLEAVASIGRTPRDLGIAEDAEGVAPWLEGGRTDTVSFEEQTVDRWGLERTWLTTRVPVLSPEQQVSKLVTVSLDITERKLAEAKIRHLAHHDGLTDLPNRLLFREHLERLISLGRRQAKMMAVHCVDLDHFKDVNDTLGHAIGDALLVAVADRLRAATRQSDIIARLGGDEFALIQSGLPGPQDARLLAEKLTAALTQPFQIEGHELVVRASIGVALWPYDGEHADDLLKAADLALYEAKNAGRNTHRFFIEDMTHQIMHRQALQNDLRQAVQQATLSLHYQPKLSLRDRRIHGLEALLRWQHPQRGWISPGEFIPVAEDSGLIVPIGEFAVRTACRQARAWLDSGRPQRIAVNLSAVQFGRQDVVEMITGALEESRLESRYLELEITESILLRHTEQVLATLEALRALGLTITLDDFGTGYSSLSYLQRFPIDQIKIDRSFVQPIDNAKQSSPIIGAIIAMAHSLNMKVVAEGVETEHQLACLEDLGCDEVQGYLISRPHAAGDLEPLLASQWLERDQRQQKPSAASA